jgi:hypothetical protein
VGNPLATKIESYLAPLLGEMMAASSIKVQCKNIGVAPDELRVDDLPRLAERIEKALVIFIGSEKAKKTAEEIKNFR